MKTLRLVGMTLFAVLMCVNFASCSNDDSVEPNNPQNPKEYMVSLGFTGEISFSEAPLSRVSSNDLYGVYVTSCPTTDDTNTETSYAYGLFDDLSSMKIKLLEGYKYNFYTTMVVDGKDKIALLRVDQYQAPFYSSLKNNFEFTSTRSNFLAKGESYTKGKLYDRPDLDRYYGEYSNYIPSENGEVSISMKRTVFGLKVNTENFTEGTLNIAMKYAPIKTIKYPETKVEDIFTFSGVGTAYKYACEDKEYSETVETEFTWTKDDGAVIPLGKHDITFKRNKYTIVTIKVSDLSSDNNINITLDNEQIIDGDNITIENGEVKDTNIGTEAE